MNELLVFLLFSAEFCSFVTMFAQLLHTIFEFCNFAE